MEDCSLTEFTLCFLHSVADADFNAVAVGSDRFAIFDFHGDLAGEDGSENAVLVKDLEGFAFDFGDAGYGVDANN